MSDMAMFIFYCLLGSVVILTATVLSLRGWMTNRKIRRGITRRLDDL